MAVYDLDADVLYVDNSTLGTLVQCSTKAILRYGYNVVPVEYINAPMQAGIDMHVALENWFIFGDEQMAYEAFRATGYPEFAAKHIEPGDRYDTDNLLAVLSSWFEQKPANSLPYIIHPDYIELPFEVLLNSDDTGIRFVGRIDAIVESKRFLDANRPVTKPMRFVVDNKTTGQRQLSWNKQWKMSSQLSGYIFAAQEMFYGEFEINAAFLNKIDTGVVPNSNRKCSRHGVTYAECGWLHPPHEVIGPEMRSPAQLDNWRRNAYVLAHKWKQMLHQQWSEPNIKRVPQEGQFAYNVCNHCEYMDYCLSGRPKHYPFKREDWQPGDTASHLPDNPMLLQIEDAA